MNWRDVGKINPQFAMVTEMTNYRIGQIVPSSNTTMETEVPAMLTARYRDFPLDRFTFHSARMRMMHVDPESLKRGLYAQTREISHYRYNSNIYHEIYDIFPVAGVSHGS